MAKTVIKYYLFGEMRTHKHAGVAELADAQDSGSCGGNFVKVQVLSPALYRRKFNACGDFLLTTRFSPAAHISRLSCLRSRRADFARTGLNSMKKATARTHSGSLICPEDFEPLFPLRHIVIVKSPKRESWEIMCSGYTREQICLMNRIRQL